MRILVIEDYDLLRDSIVQGLREAHFAVDEASDGEQGWWHAQTGAFDVIILDLMLPRLDGLSLLKRLREKKVDSHVLILTAKDSIEDRIKGLDIGADDYLLKPFAFGELLARVRALVRRKYEAKSPVIQVEDLELDTLTRSVRRSGERVDLSAKEYALLELLANRAGQVVTRSDIWEKIYDSQADALSNVVDVFIGHLRKKIEREGLPRLIHTRRGIGYVLGRTDA
ncbi:MAG TPA: response regulator transcription factor [Tepidisphaeraceae bacterium]|jgi:DNA-binding response OmpR family regulator